MEFLSIGTQSDRVAESGKENMEATNHSRLHVFFCAIAFPI